VPTWLSNGPAEMASTTKECVASASAASGERRDHAVADGDRDETVAVSCGKRVEEPLVVAPQINGEDDCVGRGEREGLGSTESTDAFSSGAELRGEFALHVALQIHEAVVPELGGKSHHGGGSGFGRCSDLGNCAEGDDLRRGEQDVGNATLRLRERGAARLEALCDRHRANGSDWSQRSPFALPHC
jgi:hypothetical protein